MKNKLPDWWPENPYPEDVFTMTSEEYKAVWTDLSPEIQTSVSGYLGRIFWNIASKMIHQALENRISECEYTEGGVMITIDGASRH